MPVHARLLPDYKLVYYQFSGVVTTQELMAAKQGVDDSPLGPVGFDELADMREATDFQVEFSTMMMMASTAARAAETRYDAPRLCILEGSDLAFGVSRMFQNLIDAHNTDLSVTIVSTEQDALAFFDLKAASISALVPES